MKKLYLIIGIILIASVMGLTLAGCNSDIKQCFGKTYSAHIGTAYAGDCTDATHQHEQIRIERGVGKPYVKISTFAGTKKAKLTSSEKTTTTFRDKTIEVIKMNFKAEWTSVNLSGGKENHWEAVSYTYYPEGDYFIDGQCILRA